VDQALPVVTALWLACEAPGKPEIFRSVQGEGPRTGRLRTFVRLAGCNLRCTWCDTPYTWNWNGTLWPHDLDREGVPHKFDPAVETVRLPVEEVAERILALPAPGIVVTGGEPLIQMEELIALAEALSARKPGLAIEIETNGTIVPGARLARLVDLFVVSPKLGHSGNEPQAALRRRTLAALAALPAAMFKFVARGPQDVESVRALAAGIGLSPDRVFIMPEGTTSAELTARGASLIDSVMAAGFSYSDRLHIHLFGAGRST
jgi:7-carboxy-7-deazaguanine synthase